MAELWKLPVIYVIENNRYAMGTSVTRSSAQTDFAKRGVSFNIPGEQVDGMDVRAVRAAAEKAVQWCREGNGPYILEMQTYRYRGHSMSDPASYRTKEQLEKYRLDDPITRLRAQLTREEKLTHEQFDRLDKEAKQVALASVKFAEESPEPPLEKLYDYTYVNGSLEPARPRAGEQDDAETGRPEGGPAPKEKASA